MLASDKSPLVRVKLLMPELMQRKMGKVGVLGRGANGYLRR
jgi:hypothetical protein